MVRTGNPNNMSGHFRVLKGGGCGRQILNGNDGMAAEERRSCSPRYLHMNNETHTKLHLHYRHMWNASFKPPTAASLNISELLPPSSDGKATARRRSVGGRRGSSWTDARSPEGGGGGVGGGGRGGLAGTATQQPHVSTDKGEDKV